MTLPAYEDLSVDQKMLAESKYNLFKEYLDGLEKKVNKVQKEVTALKKESKTE